jgi:hypothetical protein
MPSEKERNRWVLLEDIGYYLTRSIVNVFFRFFKTPEVGLMRGRQTGIMVLAALLLMASISAAIFYQQKEAVNQKNAKLTKEIKTMREIIDATGLEQRKHREAVIIKSQEILYLIKDKDMGKLSTYIHPTKGVRFSPYAYVDINKYLVFTSSQVPELFQNTQVYHWGAYDGSGEPIQLSFKDYYEKFIYDVDFANAEIIGNNKPIGQGNTINNIKEAYPDAVFVEYHFPGFNPAYEGMDWRSLRLVFEKVNNTFYLVGIVHDEWTI